MSEPTHKQIEFANDIYEQLGYELPEERTKESYSEYIDEYVDEFYESKREAKRESVNAWRQRHYEGSE